VGGVTTFSSLCSFQWQKPKTWLELQGLKAEMHVYFLLGAEWFSVTATY
jgi:hypothetical protein